MKFKLVKVGEELHMLSASGEINIMSMPEVREFVANYDPLSVGGTENNDSKIFEQYNGVALISFENDGAITFHDAAFLSNIINPDEFPYYSPAEFADKFDRKHSVVLRYCRDKRIPGVVQKGKAYYIPKTARYPEDRRAGRDMSKRYKK